LPEELSTEVLVASPRPNAVTALATSPWAPLVAISGHKQVLLYRTDTGRLAAVLPFPEGTIHSLKFSRDGAILLVAGGRGAREGKAIGFDVKTGERLFEIGKEYDIVLAADLSPDRSLVALGGPSKLLRVYNTSDGEIAYESKKHTDWITAVAFSPDGVLLASGDRNGGLIVWESGTGREFHDLRGHTAMVTDLSWRIDSNLLASASEDTTVRLWEMENGGQVKSWGAHGAGAESVSFGKDGRLVTVGRDRVPKLWDGNGAEQKQFEAFPDVATRVAFTHDDQGVVAADWSGEVRLYQTGDGKALARFVTNPAPLAQRLVAADGAVRAAEAAVVQAQKELGPLDGGVATSKATFDQAAAKVQGAEAKSAEVATALQALEAEIAAKEASAKVARDLVAKVQAAEAAAVQLKAEADQAVAKAAEVKKLAVERAAASKSEPDLMLAAEAEKAHIGAVRFATTLEAQVLASRAAISPAQAAAASAEAIRGLVAAPLEARKAAVAEAGKAVETEKAGLAAAQAAHEAASKALAEKQAAITALQAQAAQAKALADELAAEVKRHAASPGVASTAEGKPPTSQ
jgi:hypothetical protein